MNYIKESWKDWFYRMFNYYLTSQNDKINYVFVCSLLKKGFWWNKKYLSYGEFVEFGILKNHSILIDKNGMGWMVNGTDGIIDGELWLVNDDDLRDIEYFYGFCQKAKVEIQTKNGKIKNVVCFIRIDLNENDGKIVDKYTIEDQNDYNSIGHSISLQEKYMNCPFKYPFHKNL